MRLIRALRDCKQRSLTVSIKAPTVSKKAFPLKFVRFRVCCDFGCSRFPSELETNLASRWEGVRLPRASGKSPDFPRSSPNFAGSFSATSPEVLSLWNSTAIQGFPGSFPDFPGSSPDFPGSFPDFPGGQPLLWGSLTPSPDSHKLSLTERKVLNFRLNTRFVCEGKVSDEGFRTALKSTQGF